jgi:hypothetical protein
MTSKFTRYLQIRLYKIVIVLLAVATLGAGYAYFSTAQPKYETLFAGLATGLFVALIQYLLEWNEHREIETIKQLGIQRILPTRDDKAHYQQLLANAQKEILVLGNTASRLFEDFAHSTRTDSRALLDALGRGVRVRVLLPQTEHLDSDDRPRSEVAKRRMKEIASQFPHFERRFFRHAPVHSLMKVDDDCLVGPIFPGVRSKDSPTIHANADSSLVGEYLKYFEREWEDAVL